MAYIPPHKRHLKEGSSSSRPSTLSPTPLPKSLIVPHFKNKGAINYASNAIYRWFLVGFANDDDNTKFVNFSCFENYSSDSSLQRNRLQPFVFVLDRDRLKEHSEEGRRAFTENPWAFVASNVKHDILLAFERVKRGIRDDHDDHVVAKPALFARFGKVLFHGLANVNNTIKVAIENIHQSSQVNGSSRFDAQVNKKLRLKSVPTEESSRRSISPEDLVKKLKRSFRTNVSLSYMDYIVSHVAPKLGLEFDVEKDFFHVKVSDSTRTDSNLSCKCKWSGDSQQLELFKIALNPVRHLVVDISCLEKKTDLRLMLSLKRVMMDISEDEMKCIKNLISSAIVNPEVKGGLRWPLGKESSGDRYTVVGVWHVTRAKTFRGMSIKLKVRQADRFDLSSSSGQVSSEVTVKMPKIIPEMEGQTIDEERLGEMLENNLKLIWDSFLSYEADPMHEPAGQSLSFK